MTKYNKSYASKDEFYARYEQFEKSMLTIQANNFKNGPADFYLGHNQFSDWTQEEFNQILGSKLTSGEEPTNITYLPTDNLPQSIDWRQKSGILNDVKDQGHCGSCWSFASACTVESHHAIESGVLYSLSEQQQVDCSRGYGNEGCDGGFHDNAFKYMIDYGLETESEYPYVAKDSTCNYNKQEVKVYVENFSNVPTQDIDQLKAAAAVGPVSVSVDADDNFRYYTGGVLTQCGTSLNHAVVVVGYGATDKGTEYWIVRNSWGASWGEQGYINIAITGGIGTCGIQTRPSWPTTKSA